MDTLPFRPSVALLIIPKVKLEPPVEEENSKEELEVAVGCDELPVDDDSLSSLDDEKPREIGYICRKCGCTFYTSSEGEYYYCLSCKPAFGATAIDKKQYSKYTCYTCGIEFYSLIGNWTHCNRCSGKETIGINTEPTLSSNSHLEVIYPMNRAYSKYTCRVCECDFYSVLGDWRYCSKCISSSSGSKKLKTDKNFQDPSLSYILYSCKMCKVPFYSCLKECYYCYECSSSNSVRKRRKENKGTNTAELLKENIKASALKTSDVIYSRHICKICNKEFYSSIMGKWDRCGECSSIMKTPIFNVTSKSRQDVILNRCICRMCAKSFFSSRSDEDICKNCRKVENYLKNEESNKEKEEPVVPEVKYEKYTCKACQKPFYSKVGDYSYCSECNPILKIPVPNRRIVIKTTGHNKIPFLCTHCPFRTTLKKIIRRHLLQIPRGMKRTCACSQCCNTAQPLGENDVIIFSCKKCDFVTKVKSRLKSHKQAVHGAECKRSLYSCNECNFRTIYKKKLQSHVAQHKMSNIYKCNTCGYSTFQSGRLKKHMSTKHESLHSVICSKCKIRFQNRAELKCHIDKVHRQILLYKCAHCEFSTGRKADIQSHISSKHAKILYYCYHCSYSNPSKKRLTLHIKTIHQSPYACGLCGYFTSQKGRLESHMVRHKGSSPQKCTQCPFETNRSFLLRRHISDYHSTSEPIKKNCLKCEFCGYSTVQPGRMKNHYLICSKGLTREKIKSSSSSPKNPPSVVEEVKKVNSPVSQTSESEYLYKCNECSFQANARKIIRDHIVYTH